MAIGIGDPILATDFNEFRDQVNAFYKTGSGDSGYDGAITLPGQVTADVDDPTGTEYDTLIDALQECKTHQGSGVTLPVVTRVELGDTIFAVDSEQMRTATDTLDTGRLDIGGGQFSLITGTTATRAASSWGSAPSQIICEHRCALSATEDFRFYFNLGGYFAVTPTIAAGGNPQSVEWDAIFDQCGKFQIQARTNTRSGSSGVQNSTNGVYDLTTSYVDMWTFTGSGAYTANTLVIAARVDAVAFSSLHVDIRCTLTDNHTGPDDVVDRLVTVTPEARRSTGALPVPANETITRQVNL